MSYWVLSILFLFYYLYTGNLIDLSFVFDSGFYSLLTLKNTVGTSYLIIFILGLFFLIYFTFRSGIKLIKNLLKEKYLIQIFKKKNLIIILFVFLIFVNLISSIFFFPVPLVVSSRDYLQNLANKEELYNLNYLEVFGNFNFSQKHNEHIFFVQLESLNGLDIMPNVTMFDKTYV
ncbi:hypothetical protein HN415_01150 [Candidatus Woesearchaeota archaeon]|nr:hypothetical protein [Candidatus Woesearchaeota archaeon]